MKNVIIEELKKLGYVAEEYVANKNGVEKTGILVKSEGDSIGAIVYDEYIWSDIPLDDILDKIVRTVENRPNFDEKELVREEFLLEHTRLVAQKDCDDPIWSSDFIKGIKLCIRVFMGEGSFLLPKQLYTEQIFERAYKNTEENIVVSSMRDIVIDFYGSMCSNDELYEMVMDDISNNMFVVSNREKIYGAGAIFIKEFFQQFCSTNKWVGCYIIPSSIHELILVPDKGDELISYDVINDMIREVNGSVVDEIDILGDEAFYYDLELNEIS